MSDFSTDRIVAQTYFTMARAHKLNDNFDDAAKHFDMAKDILRAKIGEWRKNEKYLIFPLKITYIYI